MDHVRSLRRAQGSSSSDHQVSGPSDSFHPATGALTRQDSSSPDPIHSTSSSPLSALPIRGTSGFPSLPRITSNQSSNPTSGYSTPANYWSSLTRQGPPSNRPWWKEIVCYQVWPRSFCDSNKTNTKGHGDILGILSKLDYIASLGIDVLWLCPTYSSPQNDAGYDISNYEGIDPDFGTMAQMEELIAAVKKRGMRIILDLVINHTSDEHAWFKESRSSRTNTKADWYIWRDPKTDAEGNFLKYPDGSYMEPTNWRAALIHGSAWTWCPTREQFYLHCFLVSQPDLNWENEDCRRAIYASAVEFWLKKGVAGFRVDTANRMSKDTTFQDAEVTNLEFPYQDMGRHCLNGPRMHEYLQEMRREAMDKYDVDALLVGELPGTRPEELERYVGYDRRELSMTFDFDMMELGGNDHPDEVDKHMVENIGEGFLLPQMKDCIQKTQDLVTKTDGNAWATAFAENHDQLRSIRRWVSANPLYWLPACKLISILITTLSGTLFIFQGQEIGMTNLPASFGPSDFRDIDADLWVKRFDPLDPYRYQQGIDGVLNVGRDNTRTPVQWNTDKWAGFTERKEGPWIPVNPNYAHINVAQQELDPESPLQFWKMAVKYRKRHAELFVHGKFRMYDRDNTRLFMYEKETWNGFKAFVILNFSDERMPFTMPEECMRWKLAAGKKGERGERVLKRKPYVLMANLGRFEREEWVLKAWEARVYLC